MGCSGDWRVMEKWYIRQLVDGCMASREKGVWFLFRSPVHMWKWRKAYDFLRLCIHSSVLFLNTNKKCITITSLQSKIIILLQSNYIQLISTWWRFYRLLEPFPIDYVHLCNLFFYELLKSWRSNIKYLPKPPYCCIQESCFHNRDRFRSHRRYLTIILKAIIGNSISRFQVVKWGQNELLLVNNTNYLP